MLNAIEAGDLEGLKKIWAEPGVETIVTIDMPNSSRLGKNYALYNITACGRASIRGGLQAEYIFSLTNAYMHQIEDLKDMLLLQSIVEEFQYSVTSMIAEKKSRLSKNTPSDNVLLEKCKSYVFQHLHDKLTVVEIAKELNVHPHYLGFTSQSHLGSVFKKVTGITLKTYRDKYKPLNF